DAHRHAAVLRLRARPVRRAVARRGVADRAVRLGPDAAVVEVVARPLPLRPVRMGLALPGAVEMGADAEPADGDVGSVGSLHHALPSGAVPLPIAARRRGSSFRHGAPAEWGQISLRPLFPSSRTGFGAQSAAWPGALR